MEFTFGNWYIPDLEEIVGYKELALNVKFIVTNKITE